MALGRNAMAIARVDGELARDPKRVEAVLLAARAYGSTGNMAKAEELLKRAAALDSSNLAAFSMLGQFYYQQGRLDDGKREFERLVNAPATRVSALTMLGIVHERQGNLDEAVRYYEQALLTDSEAAVAGNNLAWLYARQRRELDRAMTLAAMAKRRMPAEPTVADTLAWVYYLKGVPGLAQPILEECVARLPKNAQFRYHLGAVYAALKQTEKARTELQEAVKLGPESPDAVAAREILATLK